MASKQTALNNPIDFLYIFTNDTFIGLVRKYMGNTQADTIAQKARNQRKYLSTLYGGTRNFTENGYTEISDAIYSQYGMTPVTILKKLLAGETVAGKNWREGVYGISGGNTDTFSQNTSVKVDPSTGQILQNGVALQNGTTTYDSRGNAEGYSIITEDGTQYSSRFDKRSNKWYANTYSTGEVMQYADGSEYNASGASSVWENIATAFPEIQKFVEWIVKTFNITLIKPSNTVPSQKEFIDKKGNTTNLSTVGIVGMALIGGALIMGGDKKKK